MKEFRERTKRSPAAKSKDVLGEVGYMRKGGRKIDKGG